MKMVRIRLLNTFTRFYGSNASLSKQCGAEKFLKVIIFIILPYRALLIFNTMKNCEF